MQYTTYMLFQSRPDRINNMLLGCLPSVYLPMLSMHLLINNMLLGCFPAVYLPRLSIHFLNMILTNYFPTSYDSRNKII